MMGTIDIDPYVRQGVLGIEGNSLKSRRGVKVTTGGEPVVGEIASLVRMERLTEKLHAATLGLEKIDVTTPEGRVEVRDTLRGLVKVTRQLTKL